MRKVAIVATASTAIILAQVFSEAWAQQHHHPAPDDAIHEKFYSTWFMPDNPTKSCCNKMDCYPTEIKIEGNNIFARRREDGKWLLIPSRKVERNRDNPDGRNHLCAPAPTATGYPPDTVFCFALGVGFEHRHRRLLSARCEWPWDCRATDQHPGKPNVHHDALEFSNGQIVLVTRLCEGQHAIVLQLPAAPRTAEEAEEQRPLGLARRGPRTYQSQLQPHARRRGRRLVFSAL
jgi:hypothetical protein